MARIELIKGDITKLAIDAIVNAANTSLLGGRGVDGAIHYAAGPELLNECKTLNGCATGEAKITKDYRLPVRYVIHTVGPVWKGGNANEQALLAVCYKRSLCLASEFALKSVAFTNISTGIYGFPKQIAANIAIKEVKSFLDVNNVVEKLIFVAFDDENFTIYQSKLNS